MRTRYIFTSACDKGTHEKCRPVVESRNPFLTTHDEWRCACDCHSDRVDRNDPNYQRTA